MKVDKFGQMYFDTDDLVEQLYTNPKLQLDNILVNDPEEYNRAVKELHTNTVQLQKYSGSSTNILEFDVSNQSTWFMPDTYANLDIAEWVINQCKDEQQLQRVGHELILFQERNLFNLLRYLKYLVDTMRENNIVWGVGRGSSVASYVLFLIGVHKIDSLYYNLPVEEFLK